jgi:diguanylate cyclase (GGDEF)-like protein
MDTLKRYDRCQEHVAEILLVMKSANQPEETLHLVVDRISRLFSCQSVAVILIHPETEYLYVKNSYGLSLTFCKEFRRKFSSKVVGELLWTGKAIVVEDDEQQTDVVEQVRLEHPFASCVCVQIAVNHRTLGYLHVESAQKQAFEAKDVWLLQMFADLAALALHKAALHDEVLKLDRVDHDSGLEKYSHFTERLREHLDRAERFQEQFALLMLDVDNFKNIVNTYGYDTSRQFFKEMGELLKQQLRTIDAAARYGVDEFVVLLGNVAARDAVARAEELRGRIEQHRFVHGQIQTTVSIGVGVYPQSGTTVQDIMTNTKNALFEAQRSGRNTVYFETGEQDPSRRFAVLHRVAHGQSWTASSRMENLITEEHNATTIHY